MSGRWSAAEAKAKFSEVVVRAEKQGPQIIMRNGREVAVVVSAQEWAERAAIPSLVEVMGDESFGVLEPEEVDVVFTRDKSADRGPPKL